MEHLFSTVQMRKVEDDHIDVGERCPQGSHARVVRPVAAADQERSLVQPDRVAALGGRGRLEPSGDRHAGLDEVRRHGLHFRLAPFLPWPEQDRAA